ncbi:MAG: sugar transferase, partial [Clostridiales Family XIII bacterium]|nr:sugar transferase [Clostridiales Family XIII bacterium]
MHIVYNKIIKRIFDFVFSLVLLILLSPFFLIIIILSKIKLGSPILFSQERPGKNER